MDTINFTPVSIGRHIYKAALQEGAKSTYLVAKSLLSDITTPVDSMAAKDLQSIYLAITYMNLKG